MSKRTKWLLSIGVIATLVVGFQVVAYGLSLSGSNFEIDKPGGTSDANFIDDPPLNTVPFTPAPDYDWANVPQGTTPGTEQRTADTGTKQTDTSYNGGEKEDDVCPSAGTGSIPNNKSDLKHFGVYQEAGTSPSDPGYLHLFWTRVSEPSGATLMDFEFNKSKTDCDGAAGSSKNVTRTAGDLLIEYKITGHDDLDPDITIRKWEGNATSGQWGTPNVLNANEAIGSINVTPITAANSDGTLDAGTTAESRTFGEASIDLDAIFDSTKCESFGAAMLKSRSSPEFNSALKDFIAPNTNINIQNCAKVTIRKETVPDGSTQSFTFTHNLKTDPPLANLTTFQLTDGQNFSNSNVLQNTVSPGDYSVKETIPANWNLSSIDCAVAAHPSSGVTITKVPDPNDATKLSGEITFDINSNTDVVDCTYNNQQRITTMNTTQKVFPNDTATVTGSGTPTGNVTFELYGPDTTPNVTTDNCTGTVRYSQTLGLTSGTARTTNGDGAGAEFAILDATEGTYWWKVSYAGDSNNPAVLNSCRESTLVTIDNDGAATSTTP